LSTVEPGFIATARAVLLTDRPDVAIRLFVEERLRGRRVRIRENA